MRIELTVKDRERFEAKVDRSGGPDACHPWTGAKQRFGHGRFKVGGQTENAHRVAWVLTGNEITEEKPYILHNCPGGDLPACCNDRHLWDGTQADNLRDMARKGRGTKSKRCLPFGVTPRGSHFQARAQVDGRVTYLGTFSTAKKASSVAIKAKTRHIKRKNNHA